jgi:hypothetical protein
MVNNKTIAERLGKITATRHRIKKAPRVLLGGYRFGE